MFNMSFIVLTITTTQHTFVWQFKTVCLEMLHSAMKSRNWKPWHGTQIMPILISTIQLAIIIIVSASPSCQ